MFAVAVMNSLTNVAYTKLCLNFFVVDSSDKNSHKRKLFREMGFLDN